MIFMNGSEGTLAKSIPLQHPMARDQLEALVNAVCPVLCHDLYIGIICEKCRVGQELRRIVI